PKKRRKDPPPPRAVRKKRSRIYIFAERKRADMRPVTGRYTPAKNHTAPHKRQIKPASPAAGGVQLTNKRMIIRRVRGGRFFRARGQPHARSRWADFLPAMF